MIGVRVVRIVRVRVNSARLGLGLGLTSVRFIIRVRVIAGSWSLIGLVCRFGFGLANSV